ncbi:MBL fold metallo-hydrolase [Alicyclobacillus dauci]|uniref:MBL fold metallo-hydrolase n=1 Tax=Alicyclobacillus dauci TaxID=1475485 RepID=A0ABY6Z9H9_9BACL|nr:MBL fold metallo-hydrolase [Alicyclobacillus dauci]WAH38831.1 MBL fold metallo-hydrolase [Alicyclobacillus dauci]
MKEQEAELKADRLSPHVFRIAVPTITLPPLDKTNTYVVHAGTDAIVVDCGSEDTATVAQVAKVIRSEGIDNVIAYIATHYHLDHTRGIPLLQQHFPAPVYAHPLDHAGTAKEMNVPTADLRAPSGVMHLSDVNLRIMHRPGHTHGHLHVMIEPDNLLIVGDHMAGVGTVWIGPPDGHMNDYYRALEDIAESPANLALPGHGDPIESPQEASRALLAHRLEREAGILQLLSEAPRTVDDIVTAIYGDRGLGPALWVATRTTQAHLTRLIELGQVTRRAQAPKFQMVYSRRR